MCRRIDFSVDESACRRNDRHLLSMLQFLTFARLEATAGAINFNKGELIPHIKLRLLLWFEFFRTIALLLGALRDLIVGYSKSSSASVKCRREIFGRPNFHPRVVSLGINVSSKVGDDGRRTGEGKELCRPTEKTPRHYSQDFSTSISSVYTDVLNLGILLLDIFTKRKNKVASQIFKICFLVNFVFKT